ncbi:MAG: DegT/DnrJ/EryC1/StrS family aminotransferase [Oscillospiraceae bacterium]
MEFRDLKKQYQVLKNDIDQVMIDVAAQGNYIMGKQVQDLEKALADYVGVKHCISCANGTDALTMVLMTWGITQNDAVFVPDFTFFASGEVVSFEGATPVFVDVEKETFNLDPKRLEEAIEATIAEGKLIPKAIIAVDLFGLPANYIEIERIAKKYNLMLLEDGAQGFGGMIENRKVCSFGDAATTSFFPAKPLGCYGDGGAIFTNDDKIAELLRSIRVHGKGSFKYDNVRIGVNSRLDTLQAAILLVKLNAFIKYELADVNNAAKLYTDRLKDVVPTPTILDGYYSSYAQYTLLLKSKEQRDGLQSYLKDNNIPSMVYYPKPMHKQKAFSELNCIDESFCVTNMLCDCVLSLPMHPYLTEGEIDLVCNAIKQYLK